MNTLSAPRIAVLLADGFEDAEAITFIDIMRRLDIHVDMLSCTTSTTLRSYFGQTLLADELLTEKQYEMYDAIMMPGGPKCTDWLRQDTLALDFIKRHMAQDKYICALCSSSAKVLAANNLLQGRHFSTSDNLINTFTDGQYVNQKVVVDGQIISGKGLGVVFEFAFTVAEKLLPYQLDKVNHQIKHIYFEHFND